MSVRFFMWFLACLLLLFHLNVGHSNFCGETGKKIPIQPLLCVLPLNFDNDIQSLFPPL